MSKVQKIKEVLNITFLTEKTVVELKERSGELAPIKSPFGGMTLKGYGSVCCLTDLSIDELKSLRDYIDKKLKERVK